MPLLTRDQIRNVSDIKTEEVDVPEWGGSVLVKALTGQERDTLEESMLVTRGSKREVNLHNLRARMVAAACVGDGGGPLFTVADVEWLSQKAAAPLDRVFTVAQRLAGMSREDVEDLTKNSGSDRNESSGSGSLSPLEDARSKNSSNEWEAESSVSGKPTIPLSRSEPGLTTTG